MPEEFKGRAQVVKGSCSGGLEFLRGKGFSRIYVDGGTAIQGFLKEDLIDEMIITLIPVLLGGGVSLFGDLPEYMQFELVRTEVLLDELVQNHYRRKR